MMLLVLQDLERLFAYGQMIKKINFIKRVMMLTGFYPNLQMQKEEN